MLAYKLPRAVWGCHSRMHARDRKGARDEVTRRRRGAEHSGTEVTMTDEGFRVRSHQRGGVYELKCSGPIDTAAVIAVREATLRALSSRCRAIVIDLADVPFVDSAGLTSMRLVHKAAEIADVDLRLVGANAAVTKMLRVADAEYLLGTVANAAP